MKHSRKLLLFDIDGTLVDSGGAGLFSLREGFYDAFPSHRGLPFPPLDLGGATDHGVVMGLFKFFELADTPKHRSHFFQHYTKHLQQALVTFSKTGKGRLLPGVDALLDSLSQIEHLALAVLTGNLHQGAWIKLAHFGIDHHFATGAYGDDHHDRNELGPIARQRAIAEFGEHFSPHDIAVIGDTPRDIACARAFGAHAIAVATGASSHEELSAAAPDLLLSDFSDLPSVLAQIETTIYREPDAIQPRPDLVKSGQIPDPRAVS